MVTSSKNNTNKKFLKIYKTDEITVKNKEFMAFRYLCYKQIPNIRNIEIPDFPFESENEAVLIEFRKFPHTEFLIRNTIFKLNNKWCHTVICGNKNYNLMKKICQKISPSIKIIKTDYDNLIPSEYSKFLTSINFWNLLKGEKILIYQEDSIIFNDNINDFLHFDFIGAPFPKSENDTPNSVGNGGLSLRTNSIMKKIINTVSVDDTIFEDSTLSYMILTNSYFPPEDIYFSKNMQELNIGLVADWETAYQFSSERIYNPNSFGGHKFWISNSEWKKKLLFFLGFKEYKPMSDIPKFLKYNNLDENFDKTKHIANAFDIDLYFCNEINQLNLKKEEDLLKYIKNMGLKGFIYHPKQITNFFPSVKFFNILKTVFIKYKYKIYRANDFVNKFIYNITYEELTSKLIKKIYNNFNTNLSLLVLVFIGNEERGLNLINKIIEYSKVQRFNISFCFNKILIMNNLKTIIKENFKYYGIYLAREFGTDITPTLLMYEDISKKYNFQHIIKLHTKSITPQYEDLTNFVLSMSLKNLINNKDNSNCIGNPKYYTVLQNDVFNKQLLFTYHSQINTTKTFVAGTIFYCESKYINEVVNFIKNNNFKSYLLNNLYENNTINKNYSPIHFLERLFGLINVKE